MNSAYVLLLISAGLFAGMLVFSEIGRRLGILHRRRNPEGADKGIASAEAAIFALLGLLIAFTFSGAASRFEERRHLVTTEANAIGTAWLRLDLLPQQNREELRSLFRGYVDARLATYRDTENASAIRAGLDRTTALQGEIWKQSLAAVRGAEAYPQAGILLLPALNDMIDITTTRLMATRNHPPVIIFVLLGLLSLVGAMLVGFDTSATPDRQWLHTIAFAGIMALCVNVIMELELPRLGLVRVDGADVALIELRQSMQ